IAVLITKRQLEKNNKQKEKEVKECTRIAYNHHQIKLDGRLMAREGNNSTPIEEIQAGLSYNYTF
ncbi:MAG: hypothetical protein K0U33_04415, partial [Bacteroidetes bacterium]|nr:hypothetical protein [Bacteroidota bacterium]